MTLFRVSVKRGVGAGAGAGAEAGVTAGVGVSLFFFFFFFQHHRSFVGQIRIKANIKKLSL